MLKIIRQFFLRLASFFGMAHAVTSTEDNETIASPNRKIDLYFARHEWQVEEAVCEGADVNRIEQFTGRTLLHQAVCYKARYGVARALIKHGANINARAKTGYTPLHIAVSRGFEEIVILLLEHGADTSIRDNKGKTALELVKEDKPFYKSEAYRLLKEATEKKNAVKTAS